MIEYIQWLFSGHFFTDIFGFYGGWICWGTFIIALSIYTIYQAVESISKLRNRKDK